MVKIIFNGFPEEFSPDNLTIQQLLDLTQEDDPGVIVEVNGRFIFRQNYTTHLINDGDRIEFIHPSFGG